MTLAEKVAARLREKLFVDDWGTVYALAALVEAAAENERCITDMTGQAYGSLHENDFNVRGFRKALAAVAAALGVEK